ncbi:MAG: hypothetical protein AB7O49_11230 [Sphingomonadales bacterium]
MCGPVVHRGDLKRMARVHDTAWTQQAVIAGLLYLYRRSGRSGWLDRAVRLADAQHARLLPDGSFRWTGHEDDRFASLVGNAMADCSLLDMAEALEAAGDGVRAERYTAAARENLERYVIGVLYRPALRGFALAAIDHYAGRDRFVANMNAVAVEALVKLDRRLGSSAHIAMARDVAERIIELQADGGPCDGSIAYSHLDPGEHIPLYTAITIRGLAAMARTGGEGSWREAVRRAAAFLDRVADPETGLWPHRVTARGTRRYPLFVAGAGMICNGRLDAASLANEALDASSMAGALLRHRLANGAIRNFLGYDHPDNGRRRGAGGRCWEDLLPTPNWNAQAFEFLCRVLPPPEPCDAAPGRAVAVSSRAAYAEAGGVAAIAGWWPPVDAVLAVYVKGRSHGIVAPGPRAVARGLARRLRRVRP